LAQPTSFYGKQHSGGQGIDSEESDEDRAKENRIKLITVADIQDMVTLLYSFMAFLSPTAKSALF